MNKKVVERVIVKFPDSCVLKAFLENIKIDEMIIISETQIICIPSDLDMKLLTGVFNAKVIQYCEN